MHLDPQVPVVEASVVLDGPVVLWGNRVSVKRNLQRAALRPGPTQEHVQQLFVLQQDGPLHQVLKVGVHSGPDPGVLGHPLLRLHVDVVSHLDRET